MVDLQKPCVKCGAVDRTARGQCRPCAKLILKTWRLNLREPRKHNPPTAERMKKPCIKCGQVDRNINGECKPCSRSRSQQYLSRRIRKPVEIQKPCKKCGSMEKGKYGRCLPCFQERLRTPEHKANLKVYYSRRRQSNGYRERELASEYKKRRLQFEFSLQNQQKALTERQ